MKKLQLFAFFAIGIMTASLNAQSQYFLESYNQIGHPRNLNQEQDDYSVLNNWELILADSAKKCYSQVINLPFNFKLGNNTFSKFKVSSTGYLTFDINDTKIQHPSKQDELKLPSSNLPNNSIYVGGITSFGNNDQVFVKTFGQAPQRQLWIKFQSFTPVHDSLGGSYVTSAIVLDEINNAVHFVDMKSMFSDIAYPKYMVHNYGIQISNTESYTIGETLGSFNNPLPNSKTKLHAVNGNQYQDNNYFSFFEGQQAALDLKINNYLDQSTVQQLQGKLFLVYQLNNVGKDTVRTININHQITDELGSILMDTTMVSNDLIASGAQLLKVDTIELSGFIGKIISHKAVLFSVNGKKDDVSKNDTLAKNRVLVQLANPSGTVTNLIENIVSTDYKMVPLFENQLNQEVAAAKGNLISMNFHLQDKLSGVIDTLGMMKSFGFSAAHANALNSNQNQGTLSMINRSLGSSRIEHTGLSISKLKNNQVQPKLAKATVDVSDLYYDSLKKRISGKIKFTANDYLLSTKIRLNAFLLEDNVRGNGVGYDQKINDLLLTDSNFKSEYFYGKKSPLNGYNHQNVVWSASNGFFGEKLSDFEIIFKPGDKWEWSFILPVPVVAKTFNFTAADLGENGAFQAQGKVADFKVVGVMYEDVQQSTSYQIDLNQIKIGNWPRVINASQRKVWDVTNSVTKLPVVSKLGIYPNPAENVVHLKTAEGEFEEAQLKIFDLSGKLIHQEKVFGNEIDLMVSSYKSGIYFMEVVYQSKQKYTGKLLVN